MSTHLGQQQVEFENASVELPSVLGLVSLFFFRCWLVSTVWGGDWTEGNETEDKHYSSTASTPRTGQGLRGFCRSSNWDSTRWFEFKNKTRKTQCLPPRHNETGGKDYHKKVAVCCSWYLLVSSSTEFSTTRLLWLYLTSFSWLLLSYRMCSWLEKLPEPGRNREHPRPPKFHYLFFFLLWVQGRLLW